MLKYIYDPVLDPIYSGTVFRVNGSRFPAIAWPRSVLF